MKGGWTNRGAAACLLSMFAPKPTQSTLTELSSSGRVERLEDWEEPVKVGGLSSTLTPQWQCLPSSHVPGPPRPPLCQ